VDCHSHVIPSGDDGVRSLEEGIALCREAARRGTAVLYATPHVWPHLPLTEARERGVRAAFADLAARAALDLRLGFELTPSEWLLEEDPSRYALEGTDVVLIEVPFSGPAQLVEPLGEAIEGVGLRPVVAHPERTEALVEDFSFAERLAERGWLLQVNATSLNGYHGPEIEELGWALVEDGTASIVASDGHRAARPPHLDEAYALAEARIGERALALFDGSALGIAVAA
jgi:protein-tyrosine phosphatase